MSDRRGFLLFEVIISIAIITGGLLFAMRAFSTSKDVIERSRDLFRSSLLLEEKIFDFEEKGEIETGSEKGEFGDGEGYLWAIDASALEGSGLNVVTLEVFQKDRPSQTMYSLKTYLKKKTR